MSVRDRLYEVALEKSLRQTTLLSYERLLRQAGILEMTDPTKDEVLSAIWTIDNPNTRRAAVIAVRSVLSMDIKIPKAVARRYDLPDEDTLRLALMTSPHEVRCLLMMYGGLRVGEACAVTSKDIAGDRLTIDKQVIQLHRTGFPTINRIAPVKTSEAAITVPYWLNPLVGALTNTEKPDCVRESLRRAGKKVGISLNPHLLRHWYATELIKRGLPLPLVSKQMRHSDISVTLRAYVEYNEADIHRIFP